jgi:hypothetical protein
LNDFFALLGLSPFFGCEGGSPAAFCYEFKRNPGRLVLNYMFMTPVVRSSFAVLLLAARFTGIGSRAAFFLCRFLDFG